jgi:uncharacterized membrane protein
MLGLTNLGVIHTLISLVALAAGFIALLRDREITLANQVGKVYLIATILTCLTGFPIFQRGGFGPPHILGILTLVVLAIAWGAGRYQWFGRASRYVETIGYSLTFFFHWIPGLTETTSRLPPSAPLTSGPDDPRLQAAVGVAFVLFLIGATLQVKRMSRSGEALPVS